MGKLLAILMTCFCVDLASAKPEFAFLSQQQNNSKEACLQCHGNTRPTPPDGGSRAPIWDTQYSMNWEMYELPTTDNPPLFDIPAEKRISRGKTFYDWKNKRMAEFYQDRCLNIFPSGNDFSCKFISSYGKTYLIRYELGDLTKPKSCCLLSEEPFWAPRPDVLRNMGFQKQTVDGREKTNWWILDTPLPGPFGYGTHDRTNHPVAFWFPVIDGWVQQNFSDYSEKAPPAQSFALPRMCVRTEVCSD